jgi:hypothetical protein
MRHVASDFVVGGAVCRKPYLTISTGAVSGLASAIGWYCGGIELIGYAIGVRKYQNWVT